MEFCRYEQCICNVEFVQLEVKSGVIARDAIMRILQKRNIDPYICVVRMGPNKYVYSMEVKSECVDLCSDSPPCELSLPLTMLADQTTELWVMSPFLQCIMSIKHKFMRKTFFSLTYCDVCSQPCWLQGFR